MRLLKKIALVILAGCMLNINGQAQFLKKLKEKVNNAVNKNASNNSAQ